METTGSNVKTKQVFTDENLQTLQTYCSIIRDEIIRLALRINSEMPKDEEGLKVARNIAQAFDTLNQAAMFTNVIDSHITYAFSYYHKGDDSIWRAEFLRPGDINDIGDETLLPTAASNAPAGQGCSLQDQQRSNELLVHDAGEMVGDSQAII